MKPYCKSGNLCPASRRFSKGKAAVIKSYSRAKSLSKSPSGSSLEPPSRSRPKPAVLVFARHPQWGRGKRRLARDYGDGPTLRWYRNQLYTLLRHLYQPNQWKLEIALERRPLKLTGLSLKGKLQLRSTLGRRMIAALNQNAPNASIILGSDIPGVNSEDMRTLVQASGRLGFSFAPSSDGGFWALTYRGPRLSLRLWDRVTWSHSTTLQQCLAASKHLGAGSRSLAIVKDDVDTLADLKALQSTTQSTTTQRY